MRILGFEITRPKQYGDLPTTSYGGGGWFDVIREPFTGAWQRNISLRGESLLAHHAVYACIERIASDIAKCRIRLVQQDANGIWQETESSAFSPVLRKPNGYQNRIQFFESWMYSKLVQGNTYIRKVRDNRGVVVELYVLDPRAVFPQVAPNGDIYYKMGADNLSDLNAEDIVPASEIMHDMTSIRHHPLCGIPPLIAATLPATQGLRIQTLSASFFENKAQPGGILTPAGDITQKDANKVKEFWTNEFKGGKAGSIAVVPFGMKFQSLAVNAVDSQLIEQLGLTAKMVCSAFGVPAHMVGVADPPSYNNIESLNQQYYSQTLQKHFEAIELLLDEGLGLVDVVGQTYGSEFDLDDLLRMDTATLVESESKAVGGGWKKPNESRRRLNLPPVVGGDTPYLQQQNYSLAALNKRDTQADPFAPNTPPAPAATSSGVTDPSAEAAIAQYANWQLKQELSLLRST